MDAGRTLVMGIVNVTPDSFSAMDKNSYGDLNYKAVQARQHGATALVVVEQTAEREQGRDVSRYAVRHLERFPLGTGYPEIVAGVKGLFAASPLASW